MTRIALVSIVVLALLPPVWAAGPVSEYAGQHTREIKALSAQEIEGLLAGRGWALANRPNSTAIGAGMCWSWPMRWN